MAMASLLTTWQSPHPDDLGEWLVGYQIMDVNVIIARCENEDDARRIVRDGNVRRVLVTALLGLREFDITDEHVSRSPGPCWCPEARWDAGHSTHASYCERARAALKLAEDYV